MSLHLYFLRHGETTRSQTGGYCGFIDPELTESGAQMAEAFADAYERTSWEAVFSSPMKRTIATAKPLCDRLNLTPQLRDGLKEINYGEWEDRTQSYVKQHYAEDYLHWQREPAWNPPTGGETTIQIASRASSVLAEIEEKHTGNGFSGFSQSHHSNNAVQSDGN